MKILISFLFAFFFTVCSGQDKKYVATKLDSTALVTFFFGLRSIWISLFDKEQCFV